MNASHINLKCDCKQRHQKWLLPNQIFAAYVLQCTIFDGRLYRDVLGGRNRCIQGSLFSDERARSSIRPSISNLCEIHSCDTTIRDCGCSFTPWNWPFAPCWNRVGLIVLEKNLLYLKWTISWKNALKKQLIPG